ncbi:hypothetical protein ABZP36_030499 [Zizania latifolia]
MSSSAPRIFGTRILSPSSRSPGPSSSLAPAGANYFPLRLPSSAAAATTTSSDPTAKKKAISRRAAGQSWEDPALTDWPDNNLSKSFFTVSLLQHGKDMSYSKMSFEIRELAKLKDMDL